MHGIRLFGMGGAGINLVNKFLTEYSSLELKGIEACYVDTSYSNVNEDSINNNFYILEGLDGSGKFRASNYEALKDASKEILHQFKPGVINIVVHSASGGSGAVIGSIITNELISRNEIVIAIIIGSTSSRIETENTLKTIQSYASISNILNKVVACMYSENSTSKNRSLVDNEVISNISTLAMLVQSNVKELDTADINNFINFNKLTSNKPSITSLDIYVDNIIVPKHLRVISAVSLFDDVNDTILNIPVDYHAAGIVENNSRDLHLPIHVCNTIGFFTTLIDELKSKINEFDESNKLHVVKNIDISNIPTSEEGIIL